MDKFDFGFTEFVFCSLIVLWVSICGYLPFLDATEFIGFLYLFYKLE